MFVVLKTVKRGDNVVINGILCIGIVVYDENKNVILKERINVKALPAQVNDITMKETYFARHPAFINAENQVDYKEAMKRIDEILKQYAKNSTLVTIDDSFVGMDYYFGLTRLQSLYGRNFAGGYMTIHRNGKEDEDENPDSVCVSSIKIF